MTGARLTAQGSGFSAHVFERPFADDMARATHDDKSEVSVQLLTGDGTAEQRSVPVLGAHRRFARWRALQLQV